MSAQKRRVSNSFLLAFAATIIVLCWQTLTVRYNYGGNWTALFLTGDQARMPPELRPGTFIFPDSMGYDGQMYRAIAHDPVFRRGYAAYLDAPKLRYRRILVPAAAFLLAAGRQNLIDGTYITVVLFATFAGVYWCSIYVVDAGRHFGWGLIFLLTPGALSSIDRMLVDGMLTALFAGFLVYTATRDSRKSWVVLALAALTRETGLLLLAGATGAELLHKRYGRAVLTATAGLPAFAWYSFVAWRTSHIPEPSVPSIFTFPGLGIVERLFTMRPVPDAALQTFIHIFDVVNLLALVTTFVLAVRWVRNTGRGPVAVTVILFVILGFMAGSPSYMLEAYGYSRPLSPLLLFVMLQAIVEGVWMALVPPLLATTGVALYFVRPALRILKAVL